MRMEVPLPNLPFAITMSLKYTALVAASLLAAPLFAHADTVDDLTAAFEQQVTHRVDLPADVCQNYAQLFNQQLATSKVTLTRDQFGIVVDRSPKVQVLTLVVAGPSGTRCVGATTVSSGSTGRFDHYYSPLGLFDHTLANPDFRAEGTKNENGIRGYGRKGLRIYDMGWQTTIKGWGKPEERQIRFQLHSTDPDILEPRLGRPDSKGCIRMPATLNTFIDNYGVLDAQYDAREAEGQSLWVLSKHRVRTGLEGEYVVVVDTKPEHKPQWVAAVTGPEKTGSVQSKASAKSRKGHQAAQAVESEDSAGTAPGTEGEGAANATAAAPHVIDVGSEAAE
jgi:hypothetical protein